MKAFRYRLTRWLKSLEELTSVLEPFERYEEKQGVSYTIRYWNGLTVMTENDPRVKNIPTEKFRVAVFTSGKFIIDRWNFDHPDSKISQCDSKFLQNGGDDD